MLTCRQIHLWVADKPLPCVLGRQGLQYLPHFLKHILSSSGHLPHVVLSQIAFALVTNSIAPVIQSPLHFLSLVGQLPSSYTDTIFINSSCVNILLSGLPNSNNFLCSNTPIVFRLRIYHLFLAHTVSFHGSGRFLQCVTKSSTIPNSSQYILLVPTLGNDIIICFFIILKFAIFPGESAIIGVHCAILIHSSCSNLCYFPVIAFSIGADKNSFLALRQSP